MSSLPRGQLGIPTSAFQKQWISPGADDGKYRLSRVGKLKNAMEATRMEVCRFASPSGLSDEQTWPT